MCTNRTGKKRKRKQIDSNGTATFHAFDRIPEKYIGHEIILVLIGKLVYFIDAPSKPDH